MGAAERHERDQVLTHKVGFYRVRIDGYPGVGYCQVTHHPATHETWDCLYLTEPGPGTERGALCSQRMTRPARRRGEVGATLCDSPNGRHVLEIVELLEP